jgi:hypothetical protein
VRRMSLARLSVLLFIFVFSAMETPSHAFPLCPADSCASYSVLCTEEYGGVFSRTYSSSWCQDENYYLRGYGQAYCTGTGWSFELGPCADY